MINSYQPPCIVYHPNLKTNAKIGAIHTSDPDFAPGSLITIFYGRSLPCKNRRDEKTIENQAGWEGPYPGSQDFEFIKYTGQN